MAADNIEIVVDDSEEIPSNIHRRIKVLELPVFDNDDKKRIERILDKVERISAPDIKRELEQLYDAINSSETRISRMQERDPQIPRILQSLKLQEGNFERLLSLLEKEMSDTTMMERLNEIVLAFKSYEQITARFVDILEKMHRFSGDDIREAVSGFSEKLALHEERLANFVSAMLETVNYMGAATAARFDAVDAKIDSISQPAESILPATIQVMHDDLNEKLAAGFESIEGLLASQQKEAGDEAANENEDIILATLQSMQDTINEKLAETLNTGEIIGALLTERFADFQIGMDEKINTLAGEIRSQNAEMDTRMNLISQSFGEKIDNHFSDLATGMESRSGEASSRMDRLADSISMARESSEFAAQQASGLAVRVENIANVAREDNERIVSLMGRTIDSLESIDKRMDNNGSDNKLSVIEGRLIGIEERFSDIGAGFAVLNERLSAMDNTDFNSRIAAMDEKLAKVDEMGNSLEYVKGRLSEISDKLSQGGEETDRRMQAVTENFSDRFETQSSIMNGRLENISLQLIEPLNDLSLRINDMNSRLGQLSGIKDEIDTGLSKLSAVSSEVMELSKSITEARKEIESSASSAAGRIESAAKKAATAERKLGTAAASLARKDAELKTTLADVKKLTAYLARTSDIEFMVRVAQAQKSVRRMPPAERTRISKSLELIENDLLDLTIISLLRKKKMNIILLSRNAAAPQARIRDRLKILVDANRVKQEKLGRYTVYSA